MYAIATFPLAFIGNVSQRAKAASGSVASKPPPKKKQKKKDPNAPKGASSAFMQFSAAKRAEVSTTRLRKMYC